MTSPSGEKPSKIGRTRVVQQADAILTPTNEGESRPQGPEHDSLLESIAHIPYALRDVVREIRAMAGVLTSSLTREVWPNTADASNLAATAFGSMAYIPAFKGYSDECAINLRNILLGADTAGVYQLVTARGDLTPNLYRVVGTLRITTTTPSVWFPGELLLQQGESLYVLAVAGGTPKLDFSADYRLLPSHK